MKKYGVVAIAFALLLCMLVGFGYPTEIVWVQELTISNIALGETPEPVAKAMASNGLNSVDATVRYQYSQNEAGPYTDDLPNVMGTWYVKAIAEAEIDGVYGSLESTPVAFEVGKAKNEWLKELEVSDIYVGSQPEPKAEAVHGNIEYQYSQNEAGPYTDDLPDVVGTWYVKAIVAEGETYEGLESIPAEFLVKKMLNDWAAELTVSDITLGAAPEPKAEAAHGDIEYQYSRNEEGPYTDDLPTTPGTWFVKAVVKEGDEYEGLESEPVKFAVRQKNEWVQELFISDITIGETTEPTASATHGPVKYWYDQNEDGLFIYESPTLPGKWYVKAIVVESDTYEGLESEPLKFAVRSVNEWTEKLTMSNIEFEDKPEPDASAVYGAVKYQYSQKEEGPYTDDLPDAIGIWFVKAVVEETDDYKGLESAPVSFEVKKAANDWEEDLTVPNIALGEAPEPSAEGTHGPVRYQYSQKEEGPYTDAMPDAIGIWFVKAVVDETESYYGLESTPVAFEVGKARNEWTKELSTSDFILGDLPEPKAEAAHGNVEYQYSQTADGPFKEEIPATPGTWYVKAVVEEDEIYARLESEPEPFVAIELDVKIPELIDPDPDDGTDQDTSVEDTKDKPDVSQPDKENQKSSDKAGNAQKKEQSKKAAVTTDKKGVSESAEAPGTGDHTQLLMYMLIALGAGALILLSVVIIKKYRSRR